jgi:hypothetical protein
MAVQPGQQTREQLLPRALGQRIPIAIDGRFMLYRRSKTPNSRYVHVNRNGAESLPATSIARNFAGWRIYVGDESLQADDELEAFTWWLEHRTAD